MKQNKTVLEKIGIDDRAVQEWKTGGLKVTYPMIANKKYFKSQDGAIFVEAADRYVPHLSKRETDLYIKKPEEFRKDFINNVTVYFKFHTFLFDQSNHLNKLESVKERLAASLALMYLFLSAMDHHYYHYDRYLVYQDYQETPVGFWWERLKKIYFQLYKEKVTSTSVPIKFLSLISNNKKILKEMRSKLKPEGQKQLQKTLSVIKMFEETQHDEVKIVSGYPAKEDLLIKSGFGLWNNICDVIRSNTNLIEVNNRQRILNLIDGHPITSTREMLLTPQLKTFKKEIFSEFIEELKRWT